MRLRVRKPNSWFRGGLEGFLVESHHHQQAPSTNYQLYHTWFQLARKAVNVE